MAHGPRHGPRPDTPTSLSLPARAMYAHSKNPGAAASSYATPFNGFSGNMNHAKTPSPKRKNKRRRKGGRKGGQRQSNSGRGQESTLLSSSSSSSLSSLSYLPFSGTPGKRRRTNARAALSVAANTNQIQDTDRRSASKKIADDSVQPNAVFRDGRPGEYDRTNGLVQSWCEYLLFAGGIG